MRRYCNHTCSHTSDADCLCDCPCDGWLDNCPHRELCVDPYECGSRAESCACTEAHDTETECLAWLRENPPDVDVRTDDER